MAKSRTTVTLSSEAMRAVKLRGARTGKSDGEVIEEAVRAHLGLDLLDRIWSRSELSESEATALAAEADRMTRRR